MAIGVSDVLGKLQGVKRSGSGHVAKCPAHDDKNASLSVTEGEAGRVLFYCHAGCDTEQIVAALGYSMADIMGRDKREPVQQKRIVATYDYKDENGKLLFQKVRYEPKSFTIRRPGERGEWIYNRDGVRLVPYNLQALLSSEYVFLVEGERDVETLRKIKLVATCSPDGAGKDKFKPELVSHFKNKSVYIIPDNDEIGKAFSLEEARLIAPVAKVVKILDLTQICPDLPVHGDITDVIQQIGSKQGQQELLSLCKSAAVYSPLHEQGGRELVNNPLQAVAPAWPELIPLEQCEDLPPFPLDALPPATRGFVNAVSEAVQAPVDLTATCVLGVIEIACQGRWKNKTREEFPTSRHGTRNFTAMLKRWDRILLNSSRSKAAYMKSNMTLRNCLKLALRRIRV